MEVASNYRPKSAVEGGRFQSQSLGRFMTQSNQPLDEKTVNIIWNGFGSYIAKQLRNGKGVFVPKFGQFTFTAAHGTTNPQQRDVQHRTPVFIVGKDFVSAVTLRTGIIGENGQIRPYDIKGANGIIPKVKINYTEVAMLCQETKDNSRDGCEQIFRFLSDKCRKGDAQISYNIPFVGTFLIRNGIAGIKFSDQLAEETRGMTAKSHLVNKLFANSVNRLNMDVHDMQQQKQNPTFGLGGAMRVTNDAENWLKSNMNISVQEIMSRRFEGSIIDKKTLNRYGSMRQEDLKKKSWQLQNNQGGLTEMNKQIFDNISNQSRQSQKSRRPMSAVTTGSRMTTLPNIEPYKIQQAVQDIYKVKNQLIDVLRNSKTLSLRDQCTSTQIQQMLKKCNVYQDITLIKCLLRDLGYNYNGPACSFFELIQACKVKIYGKENEESQKSLQVVKYSTERKMPLPRVENTIKLIKDVLYSHQQSLYQLFNQAKLGNTIDLQGFINLIMRADQDMFVEDDLRLVFKFCTNGKDQLSYQDFEKHFQWDVPSASGQFELYAIRCIREWMFKNGYSSETSFEYFARLVNKTLERTISRGEFHKIIQAIPDLQQHFTAPQIDVFFQILDLRRDGVLDPEEWQSRIYEDVANPIQLLREVVSNNKLTPEDLLFKMHLRIWDDPMDYTKLSQALRKLDGSISDNQIRHLAKVLKNQDNKVEVPTLLRNLCGQDYETVDFSNKMFKALYNFISDKGLNDRFKQLLEDADSINDGRIEPQGLKLSIRKIVGEGKIGGDHNILTDDNIDRFIRFLEKDKGGKIPYMLFLEKMEGLGNRDHNPFKSVVQRLKYFLESNKQTIQAIIKRLQQKTQNYSQEGVPIHVFADFLGQKIDKKRNAPDLHEFAYKMDVDKDGYISVIDLQTCIGNLEQSTFFKNNGETLSKTQFSQSSTSVFQNLKQQAFNSQPMPEERAIEVATQFRTALISQKIAYREAFNRFDENKDGLLSFQEFSQGIDKVIQFSSPIKEKLFALMDKNNIGLVDYPNFLDIVQLSSAKRLKTPACQDNFDWENNVIDQIKQWIRKEGITVEEVMKIFDYDFDGKVSKDDLKNTLIQVLKINEEDIWQTRLDRLFRLLDFYKRGALQLSDMQRLVSNENPYSAVGGQRTMTPSSETFRRSLGGGLAAIKTTDWKLGAIQQIGLVISKQFDSLKSSFDQATQYQLQMTYEQFKSFIEQTHALKGFNMTNVLIQQLFAEIDPHKKGYLTEQDWKNAFQSFNVDDQLIIELKNLINVSFQDWSSAFEFFLTQDEREQAKNIREDMFKNGIMSLSANRFNDEELEKMWTQLAQNKLALEKHLFRVHFDQGIYSGTSKVMKPSSAQQKSRHIFTQSAYKGKASGRTTIYSQSTSSSQWEDNIIEKLRSLLLTSNKSLEQVFREMDADGNKTISQVEFRNAIRKLNLGLTSREIDKVLTKIDTNQDQKIDWTEFCAKFKRSDIEMRMEERAKDKMGKIKELMILHMTSPNDAFKMFDKCKNGCLSYSDFSNLIIQVYKLSGNQQPPYPVIKDLFDCIDIRRDGVIDQHEWQETFGRVIEGDKKLTIKGTQYSKWELSSEEYAKIGKALCRNRKIIEAKIRDMDEGRKGRNFKEMQDGLDMILRDLKLNDEKLKIVLQPAEIQGSTASGETLYDYYQLLEIYKFRYA